MSGTPSEPVEPTSVYLQTRAKQTVLAQPTPPGQLQGFYDYTYEELAGINELIKSALGLSKSRTATEIASQLWQQ